MGLLVAAEQIEARAGHRKATRWYKAATGQRSPLKEVNEQYKADAGKTMSLSTLNNLNTAIKEFLAYAGEDVALEEVDRRMVGDFVTRVLPNKRGPKAPNGQGPATIRKKVSQLGQVWVWARKRGLLLREHENPWDEQAPSAKEIEAAADVRRPFTPEETKTLLQASKAGDALGDVIRVALLTGVRLEEVASLEASQVDPEARWYTIHQGKTKNAARVVPLVGMAQAVIKARLDRVQDGGALFAEVPIRQSTGKRGGCPRRSPACAAMCWGPRRTANLPSTVSATHGDPAVDEISPGAILPRSSEGDLSGEPSGTITASDFGPTDDSPIRLVPAPPLCR